MWRSFEGSTGERGQMPTGALPGACGVKSGIVSPCPSYDRSHVGNSMPQFPHSVSIEHCPAGTVLCSISSLHQASLLCWALERVLGSKQTLQRCLVTYSRSHGFEERAEPGQQPRSQALRAHHTHLAPVPPRSEVTDWGCPGPGHGERAW